jgi:hypothetical protein
MQVHKVYFGVAASLALIGLLLLSVYAPWHQVDPTDSHRVVVSLPRAPFWSHSDIPGAGVNIERLLLEAVIILAVAAVIAKIGRSTQTKPPPSRQ